MLRTRLYDVRASLMPESIGRCAADIQPIAAIVNEAQERLLNDPLAPEEGWWGGWMKIAFNVDIATGTIITPRDVARIILMDVCKQPVRIRNEFYEFLEFGVGYQPRGCPTQNTCGQLLEAYERETVITQTAFAGPANIRVYPVNANDVGRRVLVQGTDTNGRKVYSVDGLTQTPFPGEYITMQMPFTDSVNTYQTLDGIQKDQTFDVVDIYQVDANSAETRLATVEPGELTTQYRKYFINGLKNNCCTGPLLQVLAQCKLDFIPVKTDQDYLLIQSVPAIIDECMSIRYSRMDAPSAHQMAQEKHGSALRILFGQLDHFLGKERPIVTVPIFGSDRLRAQPV